MSLSSGETEVTNEELHEAIKDLREELRRVDYAIVSVEGLADGKAPRGRPPKFVTRKDSTPSRSQRRPRSKRTDAPEPPD